MRRRWSKGFRAKLWHCYETAQSFCLWYTNAQYFEGFWHTSFNITPIHHAWVVLDGKVYDPAIEIIDTLVIAGGEEPSNPAEEAYFGVHVPTKLIERWEEKGNCGMPIAEWFLRRKKTRRRMKVLCT
jgi:hypothetical protein